MNNTPSSYLNRYVLITGKYAGTRSSIGLRRLVSSSARFETHGVSTIRGVASKETKSGTEIQTRTYAHGEDVVIPSDEEIVNVEYDRTMAVTRVTTSRSYDEKRTADERAAREGPPATPTYPQPAGAVPEPPAAPSTSFTWGSIDTTKVQNMDDLKRLPPTIAEQEAEKKLDPDEAAKKDLPAEAAKDATEIASEEQAEANKKSQ